MMQENRIGLFVGAVAWATMAFLILPQLILLIQSFTIEDYLSFPPKAFGFRWYAYIFHDETWLKALGTSLLIAALATPLAVVIGTAAAIGLDRGPSCMRKIVRTALISPMILPHVVLGMAIYRVFLPIRFDDTVTGFLVAHLVLCVPYVVVTVGASLQAMDRSLEQAAMSLGASLPTALWRVVLPLARPGIIAGAVFAFITSFDEFIVTYFLASRQTTAPIQIFSSLSYQLEPSIAAVSGLTLVITVALSGLLVLRGSLVGSARMA
ncbi:ABC transporter permease [Bosea sp. F3-2]|uniref:ABC transporter permease n=1 Tax=Bosea sp. F3-2 TaxID=2599640 RepID=UPI0011ED6BCF|nr:ABC transporter permease [Bosea sp. F3-2]QEL25094.1 ABC transporter permease [Bosea sp. F3-2]